MDYYLGIDLGGTNLRAAVATSRCESLDIHGKAKVSTPQNASGSEITAALLQTVERACAEAGCESSDIAAAGIGSVGPLNPEAGVIEGPANITGTENPVKLVEPLRKRLQTDVISFNNDAVCGVIGERYFADPVPENLVYLTISTGIGAGVIVDGEVLSGADGNVGEVGHMTLDPAERMRCGCGLGGHWEAYAGGANIPRYAKELAQSESVQTDLPIESEHLTAKDIFEKLGNDPLANRVVERIGHWNTLGVANVIQTFAPSEIAVGGAIACNNAEAILNPIRQNIDTHVMIDIPEIRLSAGGEDIVLCGAVLSAVTALSEAQ